MRKPLAVLMLALIVVAAFAPATHAVGPLDGAYTATITLPGSPQPLVFVIVAVQTGNTVGIANLYGDGAWDWGQGTVNGNVVSGTLHLPNGTQYGTWAVTVNGNQFSGQSVFGGYVYTLTGVRFF